MPARGERLWFAGALDSAPPKAQPLGPEQPPSRASNPRKGTALPRGAGGCCPNARRALALRFAGQRLREAWPSTCGLTSPYSLQTPFPALGAPREEWGAGRVGPRAPFYFRAETQEHLAPRLGTDCLPALGPCAGAGQGRAMVASGTSRRDWSPPPPSQTPL